VKALHFHLVRALFVAASLASPTLLAQQPAAPPDPASAPAAARFSQQDLDQLLAPIALYPDALVAQVLLGSTFPIEVVEAARWSKANPAVKDKALEDAMLKQSWDPAVKALTAVPQVLAQMNEKLDWTQKLGAAFTAQQADVMKTVQALRSKAAAAGNLKSTPEQKVKTEVVETKTVYIIESAKPEVVYVPTYNPYTAYGTWWYAAPPYYMYPPAYVYPPGVAFATGVVVGAAIWGNTNWNNNNVNVNVNQYNSYNKTNISSTNAQQQYNKNQATQQYNQNQAQQQVQQQANKNQLQSQAQAQGVSKSSAQSQAQAARNSGAGGGAASSASSRAGAGGFSGAGTGSGAATREASARGGASRGGGGGGGGGGRRR
jgi:uncharacterized membrane protein YgcG